MRIIRKIQVNDTYLAIIPGQSLASPIVTDLSPRRIGYGGGAVTINGEGFSEDVFNQFDPVLGNKVSTFLGALQSLNHNWFSRSGLPMNLYQLFARLL